MDAKEIVEVKEQLQFHPCMTPRGLLWYDLSVLTAFQQKQLNEKKFDVIKEDCKYLAAHPEVRAIVGIFVREVFRKLPLTISIAQFARNFFSKGPDILEALIKQYMIDIGEPIKREGDSAVNIQIETESVVELVDEYLQPPYYCYLAYEDELSEEIEEEEKTYGSYTYSTDSFTTSAETTTKYLEFNKKYSRVMSSRSTITEPTLLRVTPAGSQIERYLELDNYEMEDMDLVRETLSLTQQAMEEESSKEYEDSK